MTSTWKQLGWQSNDNPFPQFYSGPSFSQPTLPAKAIHHDRIPSLMELCLILEQQLFEWMLWDPLNKKDFSGIGWDIREDCESMIYADRRRFLLYIANFAYSFNESLMINNSDRISLTSNIISETVHRLPMAICQLISSLSVENFNYTHNDIRDGYRKPFTDEDRKALSINTHQMLLKNQKHGSKTDSSVITDVSETPGLFWDLQMYPGGFTKMFEEIGVGQMDYQFHAFYFNPRHWRDLCLCPTPLIRDYTETDTQYICLNVMVAGKGDEMWMGVHSLQGWDDSGWPSTSNRVYRTPKNAVYYYGGRLYSIRRHCAKVYSVDDRMADQDGCWGNIQHRSALSLFNQVHLPYYQSGDWISFKIDTLNHCYDLYLNNERIVSNVDCSDLPMPWLFVAVVDENHDFIYLEQTTDICADDSEGFVNGRNY